MANTPAMYSLGVSPNLERRKSGRIYPTVLVTGCTGYIAAHVVQLLANQRKYRIRGTVRNLKDTKKIDPIKKIHPDIELVEADLLDPASWGKAVSGCMYVLHIASPFVAQEPKDENELIKPAVEGTLAVLKACTTANVKRVVLTSSTMAVDTGHEREGRVLTESDWSIESSCTAYPKSKLKAERAAWAFMQEHKPSFSLTTVCPSFVIGPFLTDVLATSGDLIKKILERQVPGMPYMALDMVDVRDVAKAHVAAIDAENAPGNRYIVAGANIWVHELAALLAEKFGPQGYNVPTTTFPSWVMHVASLYDPAADVVLPLLGTAVTHDTTRARTDLGITFRPWRDTAVEMAVSMVQKGMVKCTRWFNGTGPTFHAKGACEACTHVFLPPFRRRHHCRACGRSLCSSHCRTRVALPSQGVGQPVRVCDTCIAEGVHNKPAPGPAPSPLTRSPTPSTTATLSSPTATRSSSSNNLHASTSESSHGVSSTNVSVGVGASPRATSSNALERSLTSSSSSSSMGGNSDNLNASGGSGVSGVNGAGSSSRAGGLSLPVSPSASTASQINKSLSSDLSEQ